MGVGAIHEREQESPMWGTVKKETLFSAKQLSCDCEAALGPGCPTPLLCSALCWSAVPWYDLLSSVPVCSALHCSAIFGVSAQPGKHSLQSLK